MERSPDESRIILIVALTLICLWTYSAVFHAFDDDEFQHLGTAWLMQAGDRPYADFFEHHLVLYHGLISPLLAVYDGNSMILIVRWLSLGAGFGTLYLLYRVGRNLGASRTAAAGGIWMLGLTPMFLLKMTEVRPEPLAMLCFAAGLNFLTAPAEPEYNHKARALGLGLAAASTTLLSQKYIFPASGLLMAAAIIYGRRHLIWASIAFGAAIAAYLAWMLMLGTGRQAFDLVIVMNSQWRYRFSPLGYTVELFLSAGILTVTGAAGLLSCFDRPPRRTAAASACLLGSSIALIILVPVPYRQSFLPLLVVLAPGAMLFISRLLQYAADLRLPNARGLELLALPVIAAGSLAALPHHLGADNRQDLETVTAVSEFAPAGVIFDGRGLFFNRPRAGYYPIMHEEIMQMIDLEHYAENVIEGLLAAGLPPVIFDYRLANMPVAVAVFIEEHYLPTEIDNLYAAGIKISRLTSGPGTRLDLAVGGHWRVNWSGADLSINSQVPEHNEIIYLPAGQHRLTAAGLIWDFSLRKEYRHEVER